LLPLDPNAPTSNANPLRSNPYQAAITTPTQQERLPIDFAIMRFRSLRDLDSTDGTVQLQNDTNSTELILVPTPSPTDPNDPLRWPRSKKHIAFASVCAFTFLTNFAIGGLAPAFYILSLEFNKTMTETSHLLVYPIVVLGAFNFFWVPLANYFGKRPVFVLASGLLCACYIWGATATSFESLLWSNIVAAFAGSSTEALGASVVNVSKCIGILVVVKGWC
jgi:hypothetical protein